MLGVRRPDWLHGARGPDVLPLASAGAAIAPPPCWTAADTARLVRLIETRG